MKKDLLERLRAIPEIAQLKDFEHDTKLFIDPYKIRYGQLGYCRKKIIAFFGVFFKAVQNEDRVTVEKLGSKLHEINATKLGYTDVDNIPRGKGFSQRDLLVIFDEAIKASKRVQIKDMPDILVFADKVGPDKISDLTTNLIFEDLIDFSNQIIEKYRLPIDTNKKLIWIFEERKEDWVLKEKNVPNIDGEDLVFIPDNIVDTYEIFSYGDVYRNLVYPFYKQHLAVHRLIRTLKNGEERPDCKRIKKKYPCTRRTIIGFVNSYPEEYEKYKNSLRKRYWRK